MATGLDIAVLQFFANLGTPAWLDNIVLFWTHYVQIAMVALCLVLLFFKQTRKAALIALLAVVFSVVLIELVYKPLVMRPRPYDQFPWARLIGSAETTYSFPSGHSSFAFAIATGLCFIKAKWVKIAAILAAALTAFSRLYISVHFATDVLAGMVNGILCGLLAALVVNLIYKAVGKRRALKTVPPAG